MEQITGCLCQTPCVFRVVILCTGEPGEQFGPHSSTRFRSISGETDRKPARRQHLYGRQVQKSLKNGAHWQASTSLPSHKVWQGLPKITPVFFWCGNLWLVSWSRSWFLSFFLSQDLDLFLFFLESYFFSWSKACFLFSSILPFFLVVYVFFLKIFLL